MTNVQAEGILVNDTASWDGAGAREAHRFVKLWSRICRVPIWRTCGCIFCEKLPISRLKSPRRWTLGTITTFDGALIAKWFDFITVQILLWSEMIISALSLPGRRLANLDSPSRMRWSDVCGP
jgi:hypothetical protein